jgi:hypothetical protein
LGITKVKSGRKYRGGDAQNAELQNIKAYTERTERKKKRIKKESPADELKENQRVKVVCSAR